MTRSRALPGILLTSALSMLLAITVTPDPAISAPIPPASSALRAEGSGTAGSRAAGPSVWLCNPVTLTSDPCRGDLTTTVQTSAVGGKVVHPRVPERPPVDCFYVYPTVSNQPGASASKTVEPEERSIALYQAQRFSQQCRVFAPIYRQGTLASIFTGGFTDATRDLAYGDVLGAFRDYLQHANRGRGIVLIGHSQGTGMLRRLIAEEFDHRPGLRQRLVSAILLGGNVTVKRGSDRGGDFRHVPLCMRRGQIGCAIAYSTYLDVPPSDSLFGRISPDLDRLTGMPPKPGTVVACTNPASLGANKDSVFTFYVPEQPFAPGPLLAGTIATYGGAPVALTPWVRPVDRYAGRCAWSNGAHVLKIRALPGSRRLNPFPDDTWGLHLVDVNGTLGDLQRAVNAQTKSYLRRAQHPTTRG